MQSIAHDIIPDLTVKSIGSLKVRPGGTNLTKLRVGAADNVQLAAEWTPTDDVEHVKEIELLLVRLGTIAAGKIVRVLILADDGTGLPTGAALATSASVEAQTIATQAQWIKFTFAVHYQALKATKYHIVLDGDYTPSSANCIQWVSSTVASGGNQEVKDASWANVATENFNLFARVWNLPALLLAEPVIYTPNGGSAVEIPAVANSPYQETVVSGLGYQNAVPSADCRTDDVPGANDQATLGVKGTTYNVTEVQPDGEGLTRLILSTDTP